MMWVLALALLSLCGGLSAESESICKKFVFHVCDFNGRGRLDFPSNESELDEICPDLTKHFACLKDYTDQCGKEESILEDVHKGRLQNMIDVINDGCNKDSDFQKELLPYLPCLKTVLSAHHETCFNLTYEIWRKYEKTLNETEENFQNEEFYDHVGYCLHEAYGVACFAAQMDLECPRGGKDFFLDLSKRLALLEKPCDEESREIAMNSLDILELEMEEMIKLKEILS